MSTADPTPSPPNAPARPQRSRFQFSLLTLLILVAVVAVGTKWWIGPHDFVETTKDGLTMQGTYVRKLDGSCSLEGPYIVRFQVDDVEAVAIYYMQNNQPQQYMGLICGSNAELSDIEHYFLHFGFGVLVDFKNAKEIDTEKKNVMMSLIQQEKNTLTKRYSHLKDDYSLHHSIHFWNSNNACSLHRPEWSK